MIENLTAEQLETLRITIEYLWGRSYTKKVFNNSTLLMLMREQLDLRQNDIQWGRNEERTSMKTVAKQMVRAGELTQEQMEKFITRMEGFNQSQEKKE